MKLESQPELAKFLRPQPKPVTWLQIVFYAFVAAAAAFVVLIPLLEVISAPK